MVGKPSERKTGSSGYFKKASHRIRKTTRITEVLPFKEMLMNQKCMLEET